MRRQDLIDLADVPKQRWIAAVQGKVTTKIIPTTNIIEVGFVSKDPVVAVNVVNAIVESYLDFLDKTHKGTTAEISRVLTKERVELAQQLQEKQDELVRARSYFGDLGSARGARCSTPSSSAPSTSPTN